MNRGSASTMQLNVRSVQKPFRVAYWFLPGIVLCVVYCGGCGCHEGYISSGGATGDGSNIMIAIDQTGYPDEWATSPSVFFSYDPQEHKRAYVRFTVEKGVVPILINFHAASTALRSGARV